MIRQKSLCVIKESVRERNNISRNPSLKQINIDHLQKKTMHEGLHTKRQPIQKEKKKDKKVQISSKEKSSQKVQVKEEKAATSRKHSPYLKQTQNSMANNIELKKDLKLLVSKNLPSTLRKPSQQQVQFLRKIQKFRQQRKKSEKPLKTKDNNNETNRSNANSKEAKKAKEKVKENSSQKTTLNTDKKTQNLPQSLNASKNAEASQHNVKYHFGGLKNTRFSLDCNPIGVQKSQIEQALLAKPKRQQSKVKAKTKAKQKDDQTPSFLQVFKRYKKSFDIDGIKLQKMLKSQQNELANANQSKNASSLSLITTKTNKNNSQMTSRNQSRNDLTKEQRETDKEHNNLDNQSQIIYVKPKLCNKLIKMIDIHAPTKPGNYFSKEIKKQEGPQDKNESTTPVSRENVNQDSHDFKIEVPVQLQKIVHFQLYNDQANKDNQKAAPNEIAKNKENMASVDQACDEVNQQILEKKFVASKYYVQPLPAFNQKKNENILQFESPIINKAFDDSLLGCEIALIQKNIVLDEQFDL